MKSLRLVLIGAAVTLAPLTATAQENWVNHFQPGDVAPSVGAGLYWSPFFFDFSVHPALEVILSTFDEFPLSIGVAGKGRIGFGTPTSIGVGGMATAHLGLNGLPLPDFLQALDWYIGLGIAFDIAGGLGFASMGGVNYFVSDNLAVYVESNYWRLFFDTVLGVRLIL